MAQGNAGTTSARTTPSDTPDYTAALVVLTSLFFMWGFITCLNDILIPHLKVVFSLNYTQVMLIQFTFFAAYFIVSLPSGFIVERVGYKRGIVIGLVAAGIGCLMFYPAAGTRSYAIFLSALFVLASGITLLQVSANPYVAILGKPADRVQPPHVDPGLQLAGNDGGAAVRVVPDPVGGREDQRGAGGPEPVGLDGVPAGGGGVRAGAVPRAGRRPVPDRGLLRGGEAAGHRGFVGRDEDEHGRELRHASTRAPGSTGTWCLARWPSSSTSAARWPSAASWSTTSGSRTSAASRRPKPAGTCRSTGAAPWSGGSSARSVMRYIAPGKVLAFNACVAALLVLTSMLSSGHVAMWAILAVGLFNSIMFPTIFTLAVHGLGKHTGQGSGILCMAIVGGAIVPVVQGAFADTIGIQAAFFLPILCYLYIVFYGVKGHVPSYKKPAEA